MADVNKDGFLSVDEWKAFHKFFVQSFQECLSDGFDYALTISSMNCMMAQTWLKEIQWENNVQQTFKGFGDINEEELLPPYVEDKLLRLHKDIILAADRNGD